MNQSRIRRAGSMAAIASFALVVLAACGGGGGGEAQHEPVTRVPVMSDAAAQATREAPPPGAATPGATDEVAATGEETPAAAGETAGPAQTAEVVSFDIYFEPKELTIPANTDVTVSLPNQGVTPHNFSIDELDIDVDIAPGATEEVVINAPAGTYEFYCNVPGHKEAGMAGTLTVSEDAGAAAPADTAPEGATPAAAPASPAAAETGDTGAAPAAAAPIDVVSHDIFFEPKEISIPANTDVAISLPNEGVTPHNFAIDELGIDVDIAPGATEQVVINAPAGVYEFYCNVPGHKEAGMVGTLTVSEDAAAAGPAADTAGAAQEPAATPAAAPAVAEEAAATESTPAVAATAEALPAEPLEVVSYDIYFEPKELTIPANADVTVSLPNDGVTLHNFSIDELGIDVDLEPGATEEVVINAPAGTYEFYCNVPGHKEAGMVGTLIVSESAVPAGDDGAAASPAEASSETAPSTPATSADAAPAEDASPAAQITDGPARIVLSDIFFEPKEIRLPANTDVTLELPNEGIAPHNFSVDALGISISIPPGATDEVVINAPAGTYEYYCQVPGHKQAGMIGTLIVE